MEVIASPFARGRVLVVLGGCRSRWGCRSCRRRRRGRSSPAAGRGCRGPGRWPRSRPRTAAGTRGPRGRPGSAAGTAGRPRPGSCRTAGGVATVGEHPAREPRRGSGRAAAAITPRAVALDEGHPAPGELHDGLVATGLGEEAQRGDREVVVLLVEGVATGLGQREDLAPGDRGRGRRRPALARLDGAAPRPGGRGGDARRRRSASAARRGRRPWTGRSRGSTGPPARASVRPRRGRGRSVLANSTTPV